MPFPPPPTHTIIRPQPHAANEITAAARHRKNMKLIQHIRSPREQRLRRLKERRRRRAILSTAAVLCTAAALFCCVRILVPQERTPLVVLTRNAPAGDRIEKSALAIRQMTIAASDQPALAHVAQRPQQVVGKILLAPLRRGSPIPLSVCATRIAIPRGYATLTVSIVGAAPDLRIGQKITLAAQPEHPEEAGSSSPPSMFTAIVRSCPHQSDDAARQGGQLTMTVALEARTALRLAAMGAQSYLIVSDG